MSYGKEKSHTLHAHWKVVCVCVYVCRDDVLEGVESIAVSVILEYVECAIFTQI